MCECQAGFFLIRTNSFRKRVSYPTEIKKMGDIPISAFDPHIFQFGSLYSNLIPSSNFSIPIRVILGVGYSN
eukprot:SAG25_NODE_532_length_7148_cov_7.572847_6_plen_72_part_00